VIDVTIRHEDSDSILNAFIEKLIKHDSIKARLIQTHPDLPDFSVVPLVFDRRGSLPEDTARHITLFGFGKWELRGTSRNILLRSLNIISIFLDSC
jgi:hypothetical protein